MFKLCGLLTLMFMLSCFCCEAWSQSADIAYAAYGLFPTGSTRVLAMGGSNRVVNREVFFGPSSTDKEGLPYTSRFNAASLRLGFLGIGASYTQPYRLDYTELGTGSTKQILHIESYDVGLALAFYKRFSLGATVHSERVLVAYRNPDGSELRSASKTVYPTGGLKLKFSEDSAVGITYSPERRFNIDESLDAQLAGPLTEGFHDIVIPANHR